MHIPDDPVLWANPLWRALQRAITALEDHPQSALGNKRETEDGLNVTIINRLAEEAGLSDLPPFEISENRGKNDQVMSRWLTVNHPGAADPIVAIKIFERIYPTPIRQPLIDRIIAYLRAWQIARAKQLSDSEALPAEAVNRPASEAEPKPRATDRGEVQRRLLQMCDAGEPYTSLRDLQRRTRCGSTSTVANAINESETLQKWRDRHSSRKRTPRASSLTEVVTENTAQTAESDPSDVLTEEDLDRAMHRLIEEAEPEEKARLNGLSDDEQRSLATAYYKQNLDQEPSPLEDDPPGRRPRVVKHHKRV